jgi:PEP-CTERM motif
MKRKQLFVLSALIGTWSIGTTPSNAAFISFSEDPSGTAPIAVSTDIAGAVIGTGVESASLSLGTVTGPSTLLFRRQMINTGAMTAEGGGNGVSDILQLDSFSSESGVTVGFRATFRSDPDTVPEMGLPPLGNFPAGVTNLLENGNLQLLTPAGFSATLPGIGLVDLAVSAQSDAVERVPEPSTLWLLCAGLLLGFGMIGHRRTIAKAPASL